MNPWIGKVTFLVGMACLTALRVPHESRSRATKVEESRRGATEIGLLAGMTIGYFVLPLLSLTPLLAFADRELGDFSYGAGLLCLLVCLWLFHRSHSDLGRNWSVTLELREGHAIVDGGVYRLVRHPMYTSLFLYSFAQAFLLPNWIAGPACLVAFTAMFALRLRPEEQMMLDRFGADYEAYRARTWRLVPHVW